MYGVQSDGAVGDNVGSHYDYGWTGVKKVTVALQKVLS